MSDTFKNGGRLCFFCEDAWAGIREREPITEGDSHILQRVLHGDGERKIASILGITPSTVHTHLERMHKKMRVHSRAELIVRLFAAHRDWLLESRDAPPSGCI